MIDDSDEGELHRTVPHDTAQAVHLGQLGVLRDTVRRILPRLRILEHRVLTVEWMALVLAVATGLVLGGGALATCILVGAAIALWWLP